MLLGHLWTKLCSDVHIFNSLGYGSRNGISGSHGNSMLDILRKSAPSSRGGSSFSAPSSTRVTIFPSYVSHLSRGLSLWFLPEFS